MTAETWSRVREILEAALERPESEAGAYLDRYCEPDLRANVDSLLAAARLPNPFLDETQLFPEMFATPGTRIGHYTLASPAGCGGSGVVYRAHDDRLGRTVAVKLLPLSFGDIDLLKEARLASSLSHPNIVVVHDVLEYRGAPAMVMEFVEGRTLREILDEDGPLDPQAALQYIRQIAAALAASHDAAVLHRDLKPANVMVRPDGVVKVLDFGIAQSMSHREDHPAAGTRGYMSPEQAAGEPLDRRSDIYSFGALFWTMLGERTPRRWRRLLHRCLQPAPAARYSSMRDVIAELDRHPSRQWPGWAGAALAMWAGALWWSGFTNPTPQTRYTVEKLASFDDVVAFPSISPDGTRVAYSLKGRLYLQGVSDTASRDLHEVGQHPAFSPEGKRLAFRSERDGGGIFLLDLEQGGVRQLTKLGFHPAWSPDGRRIIYSSEAFEHVEERRTTASQLWVAEAATGLARLLADPAQIEDAIQPSWSPRGDRIAFWSVDRGGRRSVWTIPASGGRPARITDGQTLDWNPVWSPDGWLHWVSSQGGSMGIWRTRIQLSTGQPIGRPEATRLPASYAAFPSFSRSGGLAYVSLQPVSSIWKKSLSGDGAPVRLTPRAKRILYPSVSPNGEWVAACAQGTSENIVLFRTDGSEFRTLTSGAFRDRDPSWSPDGQTIAFGSNRGGEYQLWSVRKDGSALGPLVSHPSGAFSAVWSPNGQSLAWFTRGFQPYLSRGSVQTPLPLPGVGADGFRPSSWSDDGNALAGILRSRGGERVGVGVYTFSSHRYQALGKRCDAVTWLPGSPIVLCAAGQNVSRLHLSGKADPPFRLPHPIENQFSVSRDGRVLYVSLIENLAELWLADAH